MGMKESEKCVLCKKISAIGRKLVCKTETMVGGSSEGTSLGNDGSGLVDD